MRLAAFALLGVGVLAVGAAACEQGDNSTGCPDGCSTSSTPPPTGCTDASCGDGNVCADDGACYPADQVRVAHVTWTVAGQPANATTCAGEPDLELDVTSTTESVPGNFGEGWAPVPCIEGEFSFQKLPLIYDGAELDPYGSGTATASGVFDGSGDIELDLQ